MAEHHARFAADCSNLDGAELVAMCNMMMAAAGLVAKAQTVDDVLAICSSTSVFVAAFEQLTGRRVPGIQRSPQSSADRVGNCCSVIRETAKLFKLDLSHLDAERIVSGDQQQIGSFLELIVAIPKRRPKACGNKSRAQSAHHGVSRDEGIRNDASVPKTGSVEELRASPSKVTGQEVFMRWGNESGDSSSSRQDEACDVMRGDANQKLRKSSVSNQPQRHQTGRPAARQEGRRPILTPEAEARNGGCSEAESVPRPISDGEETGSDSTYSSSSSSKPGRPACRLPVTGRNPYSENRQNVLSQKELLSTPGIRFCPSKPPPRPDTDPQNTPEEHVSQTRGDVIRRRDDVSARGADVGKVLGLVERVAREEQREWERKQAAFRSQLQSISRRAYAARWPYRPLPDVRTSFRTAAGSVQNWRREEDERLRKRRKRLVALRPRVGAHVGEGMARCRNAYRSFLPSAHAPLLFRWKSKPTSSGTDRLFSKETLKQLNDVIQSPVSTLDGGRAQTPNLQTLLRKHPDLRKLLGSEIDRQRTEELVEGLPLNPGLRKGLAQKFAGLKALKKGSEVKGRPEGDSGEATWRHVEAWAEGLVPKSQPKMRGLARARLRGRLEAHQQKLQRIHAERFRAEAEADQNAAAVKKAEAEERLFKTLLERALALEREAILAQRKEERERKAADQRKRNADREQTEADIRARCALLKEEIQAKRRERMEIERAQEQVMRQLAREERERLEMERAMLLERLAVQAR